MVRPLFFNESMGRTMRKFHPVTLLLAALFIALVSAGCAQTTTKEEEFSGFLGDYSGFEEIEAGDGSKMVGWISPTIGQREYHSIIVDPVVLYSSTKADDNVDQQTINEVLSYLTDRLREEIGKRANVVYKPGSGVARMRMAITTIRAGAQPLRWYNYTPITMTVAGIGEATGVRDEQVQVIAESELLDSETSERLAAGSRFGAGENIDPGEKITMEDLDEVFDTWVVSTGMWVDKYIK